MKVFKVETVTGDYEIIGTRCEWAKYLTIYKDDEVVFTIRSTKVLSVK